MIDFHSHILPNIDDGSRDVNESLELLRLSANQGIDTLVATPHFYVERDTVESFLIKRQKAYDTLIEHIKEEDLPHVECGAEVYFFNELSQLDNVESLAIGSSRYILIEMPFEIWTKRTYDSLYNLRVKKRLIPIIAHIERYFPVQRDMKKINALLDMDVLVQMNGSYINNWQTRRKALSLLKRDKVHILGSDCHNTENRKPNLKSAYDIIEKKLGINKIMEIDTVGKKILESTS